MFCEHPRSINSCEDSPCNVHCSRSGSINSCETLLADLTINSCDDSSCNPFLTSEDSPCGPLPRSINSCEDSPCNVFCSRSGSINSCEDWSIPRSINSCDDSSCNLLSSRSDLRFTLRSRILWGLYPDTILRFLLGILIWKRQFIHSNTHIHMHTHTCTHTHTHTYTHILIFNPNPGHRHTYVGGSCRNIQKRKSHTRAHKHTHTHTQAHKHTHTQLHLLLSCNSLNMWLVCRFIKCQEDLFPFILIQFEYDVKKQHMSCSISMQFRDGAITQNILLTPVILMQNTFNKDPLLNRFSLPFWLRKRYIIINSALQWWQKLSIWGGKFLFVKSVVHLFRNKLNNK